MKSSGLAGKLMIQPRAGGARIGLHGDEERRGAAAIDRLRNAGRDNEDDSRKNGCSGHDRRRRCRCRHASLKRCVCQAPFAGMVGRMLFEVGAMLRQQPLRQQQHGRE